MRAHRFEPLTTSKRTTVSLPWLCCIRCGLVTLRNAATETAKRAPCGGLEDG